MHLLVRGWGNNELESYSSIASKIRVEKGQLTVAAQAVGNNIYISARTQEQCSLFARSVSNVGSASYFCHFNQCCSMTVICISHFEFDCRDATGNGKLQLHNKMGTSSSNRMLTTIDQD